MKIKLSLPDLAALREFDNWRDVLQKYIWDATHESLDDLEIYAQSYMYANFIDAQGPLETNFTQDTETTDKTIKGYLSNDSPYAFRREYGFSGKKDSLGRKFTDDPGIHFMATSLEDKTDDIVLIYQQAVSDALDELAYGIVAVPDLQLS
jgi:hypothetical protein